MPGKKARVRRSFSRSRKLFQLFSRRGDERGFYLLIGSARRTRRIKIIAGVPGKYSTHCILIDCDAIFNLLLSNPPEDS
jgi:hypothetical protein